MATVTFSKLCLPFETTQPKSQDFTTVVAALKLNAVFNHEIKERWMFKSMMQLCRMSIFDSVANNLSFSPFTLWLFRSLAHQQQLKSVNLQYIMRGCLHDGTKESSTKSLMFQVHIIFLKSFFRLLKTLFFCNFIRKKVKRIFAKNFARNHEKD